MSREPHTLAGAYAMYALDDEAERAAYESHLSRCEECAQEARELAETTARLGAAVAAEPPASLRARVMSEIGMVRQLPPAVTSGRARGSHAAARRAWWPRAATGLAAACLAVAATLGVVTVRAQDDLERAREDGRRVAAVLAAPDARTVKGRTGAGAAGKVVVSRSRGAMVFFSEGLAALPEGRAYQLWRIGPGGALPEGTTRPDASGRTAPVVLGDPGAATKVGVTIEPAGGSARPTTTPIMLMDLPTA